MQAKQLAFFVLALSLAGGVINSSGIFDTGIAVYDIDVDEDISDGIAEINESVQSDSDLLGIFEGWEMIKKTWDIVVTMFSVLALPGRWLVKLGVDSGTALAVQAIVSVVEAWGLVQFVTGRSSKGME